ncbi:MAG: SufS family cysteine desulfurase [Bacteroidales bacterium]|nr:SufS family cysteine desulfurase [Bacteroidales bacterium]
MENRSSINNIRTLFPALNQRVNGKKLVYLDNGATSQKPLSVIELVNEMNSGVNGNIHRAVHELSAKTTSLYEGARDKVKNFINASQREEIIFTAGTTASINLVASSFSQKYLNPGDAVLVSEGEHHSNIVPWQMACDRTGATLRVLPLDDNGCWRLDLLDTLLDSSVKIVSVAHVSNILGVINPIEKVIERAHSLNIPVLIDGAQGIVHSRVDVQKLDCEFYAFSGHKMYGPTGTGVLFGKYHWLEKLPPYLGGGDMIESVSFEKTTYAQPPLKFEAGTPNFIGMAALGAAIDFILQIDTELASKNEKEIVEYVLKEFSAIEGLTLYGQHSQNKIPLFSFTVKGAHPTDLAMLMDKMGVALRSGQMCSEPVMDRFGTESMLRASFAVYNTLEEAKIFILSLKRAIKMLT